MCGNPAVYSTGRVGGECSEGQSTNRTCLQPGWLQFATCCCMLLDDLVHRRLLAEKGAKSSTSCIGHGGSSPVQPRREEIMNLPGLQIEGDQYGMARREQSRRKPQQNLESHQLLLSVSQLRKPGTGRCIPSTRQHAAHFYFSLLLLTSMDGSDCPGNHCIKYLAEPAS